MSWYKQLEEDYEQVKAERDGLKQANSELMKENEMLKKALRQNGIELQLN